MPLQPLHNQRSCIDGDVSIDPSAAIAPGVLLIANPQSRIVIGAGVCIGMGVVLHADGGTLEVSEGAVLGAGVLLVGTGTVGARACVGSVSTVLNPSVSSEQAIAPGSLLGNLVDPREEPVKSAPSATSDSQPVVSEVSSPTPEKKSVPSATVVGQPTVSEVSSPTPEEESVPSEVSSPTAPEETAVESLPSATQSSIHSAVARNLIANPARVNPPEEDSATDAETPESNNARATEPAPTNNHSVSGHQHLERLMAKLFPHRQQFDSQVQDTPVSKDEE
ncbi:hypothetical protein [Roseofilum casamattae]|uniref:Carbon dioxide concentrating mechanism protein n=1 Tax=Roseofilum casamattae BLCC-M143 TaxID=3022442 RepID=A0ABT7BVW4_9CYAN|nr:hypothetical protein [Roseofilum casamattae]MDJ1182393.1 hypothetical protein [Roseofilum casamattae BLCC-M143]